MMALGFTSAFYSVFYNCCQIFLYEKINNSGKMCRFWNFVNAYCFCLPWFIFLGQFPLKVGYKTQGVSLTHPCMLASQFVTIFNERRKEPLWFPCFLYFSRKQINLFYISVFRSQRRSPSGNHASSIFRGAE